MAQKKKKSLYNKDTDFSIRPRDTKLKGELIKLAAIKDWSLNKLIENALLDYVKANPTPLN